MEILFNTRELEPSENATFQPPMANTEEPTVFELTGAYSLAPTNTLLEPTNHRGISNLCSDEQPHSRLAAMFAVLENGLELANLPEQFQLDPEIGLAAVGQNLNVIEIINPALWSNRSFTLEIVRIWPGFVGDIDYFPHQFHRDEQIMLEAARSGFPALVQYAAPSLRSNPQFQEQCFEAGFYTYNYMINPSEELTARYNALIEELNVLGITRIERLISLSLVQVQDLIRNREQIQADERPVALIITPRADWNEAFEFDNDLTRLIQEGNYRIMYYEADTEDDFFQALAETGSSQAISLLYIGGHGSISSTGFGDDSYDAPENYTLDLSDETQLTEFSHYLTGNSQIILDSCSTGREREHGENVANMLARIFPRSTIYSPTIPSGSRLSFDANNFVIGARYLCDATEPNCLYLIQPSN